MKKRATGKQVILRDIATPPAVLAISGLTVLLLLLLVGLCVFAAVRLIRKAASPKPAPTGSSDTTLQAYSPPRASTVQLMTARPPSSARKARACSRTAPVRRSAPPWRPVR